MHYDWDKRAWNQCKVEKCVESDQTNSWVIVGECAIDACEGGNEMKLEWEIVNEEISQMRYRHF